MARTANPYQADAGQYNAVGQGLNNLASVFLSQQQGAGDLAKIQALAWGARKDRESVIDTRAERAGRQSLGDWMASYDPTGDPRQAFGSAVTGGAMDPDKLADLQRFMVANFGGSDEQLGRAFAGAGDALGVNEAVSLDHQSQIRADNHQNDVALDRASLTLNERLGDAFASGGMDTLEQIYRRQSPNLYASADKTYGEMNGTNAPTTRDEMMAWEYRNNGVEGAEAAYPALYGADAQNQLSRDELLAEIYRTLGPEAANEARPALYGPDSSSSGNPWGPAKQQNDLQGDIMTELMAQLGEHGAPLDEDGNVRTPLIEQAAPGLINNVSGQAWDALQADVQAGQPIRPMTEYVSAALGDLMGGIEYTDDNAPWWPGGDEAVTITPPTQRGTATPPNPAQPATGNTDFAKAREAIARGADRGQVRGRLLQAGYSDVELIEAGI